MSAAPSKASMAMAMPMLDVEALVQSLPACKRCRECRRGCDTLLPKCRQCTKAGVECMFYDHGRNQLLPRSYISELVDRVRRLSGGPSPPNSGSLVENGTFGAIKSDSLESDSPRHEHHFAEAGNSYRYLGAESCLLKSPRLHAATNVRGEQTDDEFDEWQFMNKDSTDKQYELVQLYLEIIQPIYPILDASQRYLGPELPSDLTSTEKFSLYMIYSIACYVLPNTGKKQPHSQGWNPSGRLAYHQANSIRYRSLATQYFADAMEHLEVATLEPNIDTIRSVLLLAINSSFDPMSGNIGQQVALAGRLAFDLESKGALQELEPHDVELLHAMHMTIFSLENQIASTLDRPALFPEPETELCFDKNKPAEYLCSLYRMQNRFRKGDEIAKENVKKLLPLFDERDELLPAIRITLHMTHLLLNPCWGSAWHVLEAVVSFGGIHVFVTPHWVYRAGTVLIQNIPAIFGGNLIQLYSNALLVLELSSWKWPSSAALSASLVDLMQHMKTKYRPDWSDKLQQGDVRI
ncbi:Zn-clus domain-containing protein [Pyrenophora tritici-repentis]|nr:Zn-clus domain-containing protein [Pyrenophora tritici-repentis]KAF7442016.1 Zn clus domain containing protein [Pyrenophora tritici-repentis]KAI0587895.1 Zn-clus domain-containing protein [Pyrenophora tritici-repentis]KAI0626441.1 Zn-clus domain-containing protein [Pyrenophora tritici-repentis]KAI1569736.1 Zn-clus domain containing protein [Pyrenophora tritici-repentis]